MSEDLVTVRFTGAQTGAAARRVAPHGVVRQGDVIQVPADVADRYTTLHATPRGELSDWEQVELDELPKEKLVDMARAANLPSSGSKATIADRLEKSGELKLPDGGDEVGAADGGSDENA
jgi:hypothetical protein